MALALHSSFWTRFGLQEEDRLECVSALQARYLGHHIEEFDQQGGCSFTLLVHHHFSASTTSVSSDDASPHSALCPSVIVQLRPAQHCLHPSIARSAKKTYPFLAPNFRHLDLDLPPQLQAYELERLHGTPLSCLQPQNWLPEQAIQKKQERLVKSFAAFFAQGWRASCITRPCTIRPRADSLISEQVDILSQCTGKVGASMVHRLEKLAEELPDQWLRERARNTLRWVQATTYYPVVLNHGDLIPSNILINEETWEITGLVDWAEAEHLPFGTCLYGLEHLLGFPEPSLPSLEPDDDADDGPTFTYYHKAKHLRKHFWVCLFDELPELKRRREEIMTMRDMGVLLWYGYAWDDGAINRVVNETDDAEEVACLRVFLSAA
jgi:hypothetical protein